MKSTFSRVVALSFLVSAPLPSWCQPNPVPQQEAQTAKFNVSEAKLEAMALIGGFYSKMIHAESYRGRMTTIKNIIQDGKVVSSRSTETQSSWIGDAKGGIAKSASNMTYTVTSNEKTIVEQLNNLDDGTKEYRFYGTKNVWSEREKATAITPLPLLFTKVVWSAALAAFVGGGEFKIERKIVDEREQIFVNASANNQHVFDAKTGNLVSWRLANQKETTEFRWTESEFNVPLSDSTFDWKAPEGATQVAPGSVSVDVQL